MAKKYIETESSFTKNRVGRTIHGDGLIINTKYVLKNDTKGSIKSTKFGVSFNNTKVPKGTVVTMIRHTETTYSCFLEAEGHFFGVEDKTIFRWESILLIKNKK